MKKKVFTTVTKKETLIESTCVIQPKQLGFIFGSEVLQRAIWRIAHDDVLVAMSIKLNSVFLYHFVSTLETYRTRSYSSLLRKFFYKMQLVSSYSSSRSTQMTSLLKTLLYKRSSKEKFMKEKYLNKWKNYGKEYRSRKNVIDTKFCDLYKKWTLKQLIKPKKDLIQSLRYKYKEITKDRKRKEGLYMLFRRGLIHKVVKRICMTRRTALVEKLVLKTMKINSSIQLQRLLNIIKKWRFISFVNVLARKKLELMYKNLHVSYLEMADEVFNGEDIITPERLQEFSKFGGSYKTWDLNDVNLMKEMGIDPELRTISGYEGLSEVSEDNRMNKSMGGYMVTKKEIITTNSYTMNDESGYTNLSGYKKKRKKNY